MCWNLLKPPAKNTGYLYRGDTIGPGLIVKINNLIACFLCFNRMYVAMLIMHFSVLSRNGVVITLFCPMH